MLRLAGVRVNPATNGPHRTTGVFAIVLKRIADGAEVKVTAPADATLTAIGYSPDGRRFAFTAARATGVTLWVADTGTGQAKQATDAPINGLSIGGGFSGGSPACEWLNDSVTLLCRTIAADRGQPPAAPAVPTGPNVQENSGKAAPVRTYEDMLTSAHDEALFEYYFTSQLALVNATTGARTAIGRPGIFETSDVSPNGEFVLVSRIKRPFSRLVPATDFPSDVEVLDRRGDVVRKIGETPLGDRVPIGGVITGPRRLAWEPSAPATVVWAEALDGGNPRHEGRVPRPRAHDGRAVHRRAGRADEDGAPLRERRLHRERHRARHRDRSADAHDAHVDRRRRAPRRASSGSAAPRTPTPIPGTPIAPHPAGARHRSGRRLDLPRGRGRVARGRSPVPRSPGPEDAQDRAALPHRRQELRDGRRPARRRRQVGRDAVRDADRAAELLRARHRRRHPARDHGVQGSGAGAAPASRSSSSRTRARTA